MGVLESLFHLVNAADGHPWSDLFELARHPDRRPAQREPAPEFPEQVNVRTRHAAVQNVAENGHVQVLDRAQPVANRERVQQPLRGMLMGAVARVDHRNIQVPRHVIGRPGRRVPHHQAIRLHGVQVERGVQQGFALLDTRRLGLEIHGVRAQPRRRGSKADARARRVFEKRQRHGLAAQRRQLFQRVFLDFLEWFALVEKKPKFVRRERFESEQIAEAVGQFPDSDSSRVPKNFTTCQSGGCPHRRP
ncbi:MAG: hypothetical protein AUH13_04975 [Acidobacteria bacterium 13_2_20CM_58_27]|nr:MAG: hypothetical protein AUH13_04975 [Acidobacteria bacterium 13_2_20CM_58_27]